MNILQSLFGSPQQGAQQPSQARPSMAQQFSQPGYLGRMGAAIADPNKGFNQFMSQERGNNRSRTATTQYLADAGFKPNLIEAAQMDPRIMSLALKEAYERRSQSPKAFKPSTFNYWDDDGRERKGYFDQQNELKTIGGARPHQQGIRIGKDGTVQIGGYVKGTEGQSKANIYATRMEASNQVIDSLEKQGTDFWQQMASNVPLAGNYMKSSEFQKYEQAKRDFVNATLRQESGAVISDAEFANAERQYFPQPGDGPEVISQKKANRQAAMQAIRQASGPYQALQGTPSPQAPTANGIPDLSKESDEGLREIMRREINGQ